MNMYMQMSAAAFPPRNFLFGKNMVLIQYGTTIMILYDSGAVVWPGWDPFAPASLDRHGASALEAGWHFHVLQEAPCWPFPCSMFCS